MGEEQDGPFQLSSKTSLETGFRGRGVIPDGDLILLRELGEPLGFGDLIVQHLTDSHCGKNPRLPLAGFLRQSVYDRIAGGEEVDGVERLGKTRLSGGLVPRGFGSGPAADRAATAEEDFSSEGGGVEKSSVANLG
jgi:hypothetical protein